jgi:two-component system response regulator
VLLVEDDHADIYLIRRAIADCGPHICVWVVSRGNDVLAFLRKAPPFVHVPTPSLILLDLTLPGRDGRALLADIRRMPAHRKTPVVIISARSKAAEEPRCRQLGANAYVEKVTDFTHYFGSVKHIARTTFQADRVSG